LDDAAGLPARRIALEILLRVDTTHAFADALLGKALPRIDNPADRRFITQLVLGALAWRGRYDYEISLLASRPLNAIAPPLLNVLRMGLHQLRALTRVPPHAAVNTSVRLAREFQRSAGASGFVNAILRQSLRRPVALPDRERDEVAYMSVAYSHPRWLVERFRDWFGDQTEGRLASNNEPAPNAVRLTLDRGDPAELLREIERNGMSVARRGPYPEVVILASAPIFDCSAYRDGLFTPQSEASQLISRMLSPSTGATVIDCAAAPGGKSAHLAQLVGGTGRVIAMDRKLGGLKDARATARRLGHRNLELILCDSAAALPLPDNCAEYVLLDAPCSGLGTLREHPEIRWRLKPADLRRLSRVQSSMLERAAKLVREDGVLLYSVCSPATEEGAAVIEDFLAAHTDFAREATPLDEEIRLHGFFAGRLRRRRGRLG